MPRVCPEVTVLIRSLAVHLSHTLQYETLLLQSVKAWVFLLGLDDHGIEPVKGNTPKLPSVKFEHWCAFSGAYYTFHESHGLSDYIHTFPAHRPFR